MKWLKLVTQVENHCIGGLVISPLLHGVSLEQTPLMKYCLKHEAISSLLLRMYGPTSLPMMPSAPLSGGKKDPPPPPPPRPARTHTRSSSLDLNKFSKKNFLCVLCICFLFWVKGAVIYLTEFSFFVLVENLKNCNYVLYMHEREIIHILQNVTHPSPLY